MNNISKNAIVSPKAILGDNITIKDFSIIEDDVIINDNAVIKTNVLLHSGTRLGKNVTLYNSTVIGSDPHDLKFKGEYSTAEIGDNTIIREFSTISRGTIATGKTIIGNKTFIMAYVHIPHDSVIGNNVIISNTVQMGGHCRIDDWAIVGGLVGIHQFVRVGTHSFIAFSSRVTQDIPPYILAAGSPLHYKGLNLVGLKRRGFSDETIQHIKETYNIIYGSQYNISDAVKAVKESVPPSEEVKNILNFIESSERGIIRK